MLILLGLFEDNNILYLILSPANAERYGAICAGWGRYFANGALTTALFSAIIQPFDGNSSENNRKETGEKVLLQGCQSKEQESF